MVPAEERLLLICIWWHFDKVLIVMSRVLHVVDVDSGSGQMVTPQAIMCGFDVRSQESGPAPSEMAPPGGWGSS